MVVDDADFKVVQIAANDLTEDIHRVSGAVARLSRPGQALAQNSILIGTLGHSPLIDGLTKAGKINAAGIAGKWESFLIAVVADPMPGMKVGLVIAGSDRRGTAFGVFEVSRGIGVSPWYWWADVAPVRADSIFIRAGSYQHGPPSVKYRGIFINDEDWGMQPWAAKTFEPETGDIGPKTYAKIFELLLRLKANCIWPAMHPCTKAFNLYARNRMVADDYAIVMGSSHCEPLLRNNVTEWDLATRGPWSYVTNQKGVDAYWEQRLQENGRYENLYTIGMRGIHDGPMPGGHNIPEKVRILQHVIDDQREMLARIVRPDVAKIPQVFCAYKEVLPLYQNGLKVPDDVSLVWADDNHGYIRQLCTPEEQKRPGGSGVYYHVSYWGAPHDYLWLCSTPPALVGEEMSKAYDYGARSLWMLNVGDLKPAEVDIDFFMRMAWDITQWSPRNVHDFLVDWARQQFGPANANDIADVMTEYYTLNYQRKPEHMGWNLEGTPISAPELSDYNYGDETQLRLDRLAKLTARTAAVSSTIAPERKDAFYELVFYPVRCADLMNQKILYAHRSIVYASQGRPGAGDYAAKAQAAFDQIQIETKRYNEEIAGGKWRFMMSDDPHPQAVFKMPKTAIAPKTATGFHIAIEGMPEPLAANSNDNALPTFSAFSATRHFIDVFGSAPQSSWKASASAPWIVLSQSSGGDQRLWVSVDVGKAPIGDAVAGSITFRLADATQSVAVKLFNPATPRPGEISGVVEEDGCVSVLAAHFTRNIPRGGAGWQVIQGLGRTGNCIAVYPTNAASIDSPAALSDHAPELNYDMYLFDHADAKVSVFCIPTHRIHPGRRLRYAIAIDSETPRMVDVDTAENDKTWAINVLRAAAIGKTEHKNISPGKHTLKIWMVDPGVLLDKIVVDLGGLRSSYLGPPETIAGAPAAHAN